MKNYELVMPKKVIAGENSIDKLGEYIRGEYTKAVIFTGDNILKSGLVDLVTNILDKEGLGYSIISDIPSEPTYLQAQRVIDDFIETRGGLIIALGGGSTIDIAKLASLLGRGQYKVKDLLDNPSLGKKEIPSIVIPTTAGTGAEATPNSIVLVPEDDLKVGIVNTEMIPDYVFLDNRTLKTVPFKVKAATGIDTLCHAIECITSNKANPISNTFAYRSMELVMGNIVEACMNNENIEAQNSMLLAAFLGGVAITASGTTGVHALSYPLGGKYHIAHGVSNAILLMPVLRFNEDVCRSIYKDVYDYCFREDKVERSDEEKSSLLLDKIDEIVRVLEIPRSLKEFNISEEDIESLSDSAMEVKRLLNNNRKEIKKEDAMEIYREVI